MTFNRLDLDQVNSSHRLFIVLRKLKLIGLMKTTTEQVRITESGRPPRYNLILEEYDGSMKGRMTAEEAIERYFAASFEVEQMIQACTRQTE